MFIASLDRKSFITGFITSLVLIAAINLMIPSIGKAISILNVQDTHSNLPLANVTEQSLACEEKKQFNSMLDKSDSNSDFQAGDGLPTWTHFENWQEVLTKRLTAQQMLFFSDEVPKKIITAINNDEALFSKLLQQIKHFDNSQQRHFLVQVLGALNKDKKQQAANELLNTERIVDQVSAVSIIMSIDDDNYKTEMSTYLIQSLPADDVLDKLLRHLSTDDNKNIALNIKEDIQDLYENIYSSDLKGLALQVIMKTQPDDIDVLEQVSEMVSSNDPNDRYQGLNILSQQLNDYGISLSSEQKNDVYSNVKQIADDTSQSIKNRLQALNTLEVLEANY